MFGNPVKKLDNELTAGWMAMSLPSPLGTEEKLNRIVSQIHAAAKAAATKGRKDEAVAAINGSRRLDETNAKGDLWREMLDAVLENL